MLCVKHVSKVYRSIEVQQGFWNHVKSFVSPTIRFKEALKPLSFNIEAGECVGLLGPNGAGKTTVLKILSGLITPTTGSCLAFDKYHTSQRPYDYLRQIGMVMGQRQQLLNYLPAMDSFYLSKALYEIPTPVFKQRLDHLLSLLGVQDKVSVAVRRLSLGERMKLELILALLHAPKILFLDEPTIGLDFQASKIVREFLAHIHQEQKVTILLTSHYNKDIEALAKRVILIHSGALFFDGLLQDLDPRLQGANLNENSMEEVFLEIYKQKEPSR